MHEIGQCTKTNCITCKPTKKKKKKKNVWFSAIFKKNILLLFDTTAAEEFVDFDFFQHQLSFFLNTHTHTHTTTTTTKPSMGQTSTKMCQLTQLNFICKSHHR